MRAGVIGVRSGASGPRTTLVEVSKMTAKERAAMKAVAVTPGPGFPGPEFTRTLGGECVMEVGP
jgi:hypothetical protein